MELRAQAPQSLCRQRRRAASADCKDDRGLIVVGLAKHLQSCDGSGVYSHLVDGANPAASKPCLEYLQRMVARVDRHRASSLRLANGNHWRPGSCYPKRSQLGKHQEHGEGVAEIDRAGRGRSGRAWQRLAKGRSSLSMAKALTLKVAELDRARHGEGRRRGRHGTAHQSDQDDQGPRRDPRRRARARRSRRATRSRCNGTRVRRATPVGNEARHNAGRNALPKA